MASDSPVPSSATPLPARSDGKPTVSVVIPVYNEGRRIEACLRALTRQSPSADEIVIVDNNCSDDTIEIAKTFPGVRIVVEQRQGITYARATGFDSAAGEIIAGIDADTVVGTTWLASIRSSFAANPDLDALAGDAGVRELSPGDRIWAVWYYRIFRAWHERSIGVRPMLYGFNSSFRRAAWTAVRDVITFEDGRVSEDVDLTISLLKTGHTVKRSRGMTAKCLVLNSIKFGKLHGYYLADGIALRRHEYGNRRRWAPSEEA